MVCWPVCPRHGMAERFDRIRYTVTERKNCAIIKMFCSDFSAVGTWPGKISWTGRSARHSGTYYLFSA